MKSQREPEQTIVPDRLTSLERAAKIAREVLADLSGEVAARRMGITRTTLARKIADMPLATREERERRPHHLAAGEVAMMGIEQMLSFVNRMYLEPNGYTAVKLPNATKSGSNLELVASMHRESSEATTAALSALSKGHIDRGRALSAIKEARESIAVSLEFIAVAESALREGVVGFSDERGAA